MLSDDLLTHFRLILNSPLHFILEELNFISRYVRQCDLDIPREKWLNYLLTVDQIQQNQICMLQYLI